MAEKLGVPGIHRYSLRDINNNIMLNEDVEAKARLDRMAHVSEGVNMIYSHVENIAQRATSEVVWRKLKMAAPRQAATRLVLPKVAGKGAKGSWEGGNNELIY